MEPDDITGKPILLYIRADDLAPFVEQVDLIKASTSISQMRFWFQSPNRPREIPCEAIIFGAACGIVAVVRRCKPFVRKQLVGSREQCDNRGSSLSSRSSRSLRWDPYGSSQGSEFSDSSFPSTYSDYGFTPPHNVPRATLDRIKVLQPDEKPARPIPGLLDDTFLMHERATAPVIPAFKEVIVQHYSEDDGDDGVDVDMVVRGVAISRLDGGDVDL